MSLVAIFVLLMILWLLSIVSGRLGGPAWFSGSGDVILFCLLLILGYSVFGPLIKG